MMTFSSPKVAIVRQSRVSYDQESVDAALHDALVRLGCPSEDPLCLLVTPGDRVAIKPNLIRQSHSFNADWDYVITHHSVIRAVLRLVTRALRGHGHVTILDGPQTDSDFDAICRNLQLHDLVADARAANPSLAIELVDLRREVWKEKDGVVYERRSQEGDPRGYVEYDLTDRSEFLEHAGNGNYYGADYDFSHTKHHHSDGHHRYLISGTIASADVVINLPKLKTHKKCGVTMSLKNMVGINGDKNYLPHFTFGTSARGGDEFPGKAWRNTLQSHAIRTFKRIARRFGARHLVKAKALGEALFGRTEDVIRSGNWYGNDTIWRMILDLNKLMLFGRPDATFQTTPRRYLTIIDGILAGEGNGPQAPDCRAAGVLAAGLNPVAVDVACAHVMGFDFRRIPMLAQAFATRGWNLAPFNPTDILVTSNDSAWSRPLLDIDESCTLSFAPHFGWRGHIELPHRIRMAS